MNTILILDGNVIIRGLNFMICIFIPPTGIIGMIGMRNYNNVKDLYQKGRR